ncbi:MULTISPECIES: hypothetical protein [unclassified Streptomyces]|uniref:hypothetical protein n=1 Tax=unclassified Streptomyces TaxID=2593676 RepID=UPI0028C405E7|nr:MULTISPECIES: hypothetical protein [unclassified Streptomyces]WNO76043.1 hypothetical protein RPQ07_32490 [Streptomyces sp. AM8-1-1]
MSAASPRRSSMRRPVAAAATVVMVAVGVTGLVSCGGDYNGSTSSSYPSPRPTPPETASFSGDVPSALASDAASARAAASAAASSASAAASALESSISAEVGRANQEAAEELKDVKGGGNARADVTLRGKPVAETGGLRAVIVNITNSTDEEASYAVQVDFRDSSGKVVESRVVGAQDLAPGKSAQPLAISRKPADLNLTPTVAKAQRY